MDIFSEFDETTNEIGSPLFYDPNEAEKKDRLSPGERGYDFTPAEWTQWLEQNMPDMGLTANMKQAGNILYELCQGAHFIDQKLGKRLQQWHGQHPKKWNRPTLSIVPRNVMASGVEYRQRENSIYVSLSYLIQASANETNPLEKNNPAAFIFHGTHEQAAALAGVEEAHHAAKVQVGGKDLTQPDREVTSPAEYHASDHEYAALQRQIEFAEQRNFPSRMIESLRELSRSALAHRILNKTHRADKK